MATPNPPAAPSLVRAVLALLTGDRLTQLTCAASLVLVAFLVVPTVPIARKELVASWFALPFLCVIFIAFWWRHAEIVETEERRFWHHLSAGFGWLLVVAVLYKMPAPEGLPANLLSLGANLAFAVYYFFLVLATECEPDRPHRPAPDRFESLLTWPAAGVFVLGFLVYFTLLPPFEKSVEQSAPLQTVHLFLALDGYLVLRFCVLARLSDSPRWRLLYGAWALTFCGSLIDDVLRLAVSAHQGDAALIILRRVFWLLTPVLAVLAIRLRHLPLARSAVVRRTTPYADAHLPAASSRTLVFALGFPIVHLLFHKLELLNPAQKPMQTAVAFGWMLLLGLVALAQSRLLDRRAGEIWTERKRFEERLSTSEDDLRLILERRRATRSLEVAEARFERIFRVCPDAVAITTEEEGRVVDANLGFERVTGFERGEILGHTLAELGIRSPPEGREELIRQLDKRGSVVELEVNFRHRSGKMRIARILLDRLTIGGQRCLITIARDITARRRIEVEREKQAALLDNASVAIYALDGEERISFWNRGAERLFGQKAGEALGHSAGDLGRAPQPGATLAIDLWSTPILDDQGRPAGRLVIASEAKPS